MQKLIKNHLIEFAGYKAVQPLEVLAERARVPVEQVIKLDANENPYGCSPRIQQALAELNNYHIYPDPQHRQLREMLEEYTGIGREHIAVGSGSDELIDLMLRISINPGEKIIDFPPTFLQYSNRAELCGGKVISIPRGPEFQIDVSQAKSAVDENTNIMFVSSPNNPTGNTISEVDIQELVSTGAFVVVDEAYYEFSGSTVAHLVSSYPNLIVLRSFSKWAGLAGLRVGYGIFPQWVNEIIYKAKATYNVNTAAQIAARESLADVERLRERIQAIISERERLFRMLKEQGILDPFPSQANFILCQTPDGQAAHIKEKLEREGIFVRYFDTPMLSNMIRITVGKPEHSDALIKALEKVS